MLEERLGEGTQLTSRLVRHGALGLMTLAFWAGAIAFSAPASAAPQLPPCGNMTEFQRSGYEIMVPTEKLKPSCQIGRDFAANRTIVSKFQFQLRRCYPDLNLASPYSDEKVGNIDHDGYFGPRTVAALKAVQKHIGTDADGIYGPNTRDRIKFLTPDRVKCYRY